LKNHERYIAEEFVLKTAKNVFLTGKAGTGKTTFLRDIVAKTTKNTVVVAPTGVAAINAKGVTIHSMFQLPLTAFIPSNEQVNMDICTNQYGLAQHMKYRSDRRKLLESLELLIIDEISMVRADLLDAIDFILKRIRKNSNPFGGVQLLVIGDLFQLSPVVKQNIEPILRQYYKSPFFFDAKAWQISDPIKIELKKIYRQKDKKFINILNNIRKGNSVIEDIETLNSNYKELSDEDDTLVLTTHNYKADKINSTKLENLTTKKRKFKADISGTFNESAYPISETIELKKGAQVMFVKNDSEGEYFNGKIGTVVSFSGDLINVRSEKDDHSISVSKEEWKNTRYTIDKEKKTIEQETIGSFEQFPLKLAWAITVHKSQGLTFDKLNVDLSQTFAPGQMYVALSRSRTLEGLTLSSKVKADNIITDKRILDYHKEIKIDKKIEEILEKAKEEYSFIQLVNTFHFASILNQMTDWKEIILENKIPQQGNAMLVYNNVRNAFDKIVRIGNGFQNQLIQLNKNNAQISQIADRILKSIDYFTDSIYKESIELIEENIKSYKIKKGTRKYIRVLIELRNDLWGIIDDLYNISYKNSKVYQKEHKHQKQVLTSDKKEKKAVIKGETQMISLKLFQDGKTLEQIAESRNLKLSTIQGHMQKWIEDGTLELSQLMDEKKMNKLVKYYKEKGEETELSDLVINSPIKASYSEMRWVRAHLGNVT